jgi:hypothetical protein
MNLRSLVKPLGWFSIGLGVAELLAPRRIAEAHGEPRADTLVRGFGVREIAAGIGILAAPQRSAGLWARAAGDVLDIGAAGLAAGRGQGRARAIALGSLAFCAGALVIDLLTARAVAAAAPEPEAAPA